MVLSHRGIALAKAALQLAAQNRAARGVALPSPRAKASRPAPRRRAGKTADNSAKS